jgi:hypothetical protein
MINPEILRRWRGPSSRGRVRRHRRHDHPARGRPSRRHPVRRSPLAAEARPAHQEVSQGPPGQPGGGLIRKGPALTWRTARPLRLGPGADWC